MDDFQEFEENTSVFQKNVQVSEAGLNNGDDSLIEKPGSNLVNKAPGDITQVERMFFHTPTLCNRGG